MQGLPRITVVTPSFNQAKFIRETIESVLNQNYPNLEYFVIDGGSTDGSVDIIREYENHLDWWISEPDAGQADAIGKGFDRATGELLGWLNSDDLYFPGALKKVGEAYKKNPTASLYVGGLAVGKLNAGTTIRRCSIHPPQWAWLPRYGQFLVTQQSSFYNREIYHKIGGIDRTLHMRMDGDLFYRLLQENPTIGVVGAMLGFIRWHGDTKTVNAHHKHKEEVTHFLESIGLSGWRYHILLTYFRLMRLISGSYFSTLFCTLKFMGMQMEDIWSAYQ